MDVPLLSSGHDSIRSSYNSPQTMLPLSKLLSLGLAILSLGTIILA